MLAGAVELAAEVRAGRRSAVEVLAEHEARARAAADLNALTYPLWESARAAAVALDALPWRDRAELPLAGVPMTVKDIICVAGAPTSAGTAAWADRVAVTDASAVASIRAAGALIVGKSNLPELAFGTTTDNPRFGRTLNPLAADRTPGGSSGGEAAAVAAGISAAGLGGDYGGSIRWPAQCTGLVALRPTAGRVPGTGQVPGAGGALGDGAPPLPSVATQQGQLQVIGPIARTVGDLRLVLDVTARPDGIDVRTPPWTVTTKPLDEVRIAWSTGEAIGSVRAEVAAAIEAAVALLAPSVRSVVAAPAAFTGCREAYNDVRVLEAQTDHLIALGDDGPAFLDRLTPPPGPDPVGLALAWGSAVEVRRRALGIFRDADVVILPVAGGPAAGFDGSVDIDGRVVGYYDLMAHCRAVSLLAAPSVSIPVATSAEGLPLSVQIVAAPWHDHLALDVAARLEEALR